MTTLEAFALFVPGDTLFDLMSSRRDIHFDLDAITAIADGGLLRQVILRIPDDCGFGVTPPDNQTVEHFSTLPEALGAAAAQSFSPGQFIQVIRGSGPSGPLASFITAWAPLRNGVRLLSVTNPFYEESHAGR